MKEMKTFWIRYGLSGGFGGCESCDWETIAARDEDEAYGIAYEAACELYESYDGMHGLRSVYDIMEEDEVDEDEALATWAEEREGWLDYEVSSEEPGEDD